jgi:hypothetical protein
MSHLQLDIPIGQQTVEDLKQFLAEALDTIQSHLNDLEALDLRVSHKAPERPRDGMIVFADGTNWNPGAGRGLYV